MKKYIAPLGLIALLLTGCSTPTTAEAPVVEPAAPASSAAATDEPVVSEPSPLPEESTEAADDSRPEGEYSDRGNLVMAVGEGAAIESEDGEPQASFVINSITVDAPCTSPDAEPAENGHLVTLDVSVETTAAVGTDDGMSSFAMDPYYFKAISSNGTTSNASPDTIATDYCYDDAQLLPATIGPGEKATGLVVLDLESPEGILVYEDYFSYYGWEWTYPQ